MPGICKRSFSATMTDSIFSITACGSVVSAPLRTHDAARSVASMARDLPWVCPVKVVPATKGWLPWWLDNPRSSERLAEAPHAEREDRHRADREPDHRTAQVDELGAAQDDAAQDLDVVGDREGEADRVDRQRH